MAGVKGRSGGARPGAGRKPKVLTRREQHQEIAAEQKAAEQKAAAETATATAASLGITDPRDFLLAAMQSRIPATPAQMDAAKALLPYFHGKIGETGKKEERNSAAEKVGGVYARSAPPQQPLFGSHLN